MSSEAVKEELKVHCQNFAGSNMEKKEKFVSVADFWADIRKRYFQIQIKTLEFEKIYGSFSFHKHFKRRYDF